MASYAIARPLTQYEQQRIRLAAWNVTLFYNASGTARDGLSRFCGGRGNPPNPRRHLHFQHWPGDGLAREGAEESVCIWPVSPQHGGTNATICAVKEARTIGKGRRSLKSGRRAE